MLHRNIVPRNRGYKAPARWRFAHALIRVIDLTSGIPRGQGVSLKAGISEEREIDRAKAREFVAKDASCFSMGNTKHSC